MSKRARTLLLADPFVSLSLDGTRVTAFYAIEFLADDGVWIRVANATDQDAARRMAQHYIDSKGHAIGSCPSCGAVPAPATAN